MHVTAIIAAAGSGRRLGGGVPKQLLELGDRSILQRSVEAFVDHPRVADVIVVLPAGMAQDPPAWMRRRPGLRLVTGGDRRQDSVANAFEAVDAGSDIVIVHDAARPFVTSELITRAIDAAIAHGAAIAALPATDTVKRVAPAAGDATIVETIPRETVYLAQTPQAFRRQVLAEAVALGKRGGEATDEAALAEHAGHPVHIVQGDPRNVKITTRDDLEAARGAHDDPSRAVARIGTGYDLHRLVDGRPLILGGVTIPSDRGAAGHSDADSVCHAATDAILGAASLGDIGHHFPDSDATWKDATSTDLLRRAARMVRDQRLEIANVDVTVILERPRIQPFVQRIREGLAAALDVPVACVSVKAKTNEGVDAVGRGEAIAAHAVALLRQIP